MRIKTPFSHRRYSVLSNKYYIRPWKIAIKCWWEWDVLPWFIKSDYCARTPDKPFYRWNRKERRKCIISTDDKIK